MGVKKDGASEKEPPPYWGSDKGEVILAIVRARRQLSTKQIVESTTLNLQRVKTATDELLHMGELTFDFDYSTFRVKRELYRDYRTFIIYHVPDYRLADYSGKVGRSELVKLLLTYGSVRLHHRINKSRLGKFRKLLEKESGIGIEMEIVSGKLAIIRDLSKKPVQKEPKRNEKHRSTSPIRVIWKCEGLDYAEKYLDFSNLGSSPEDIEEKISRIQKFLSRPENIEGKISRIHIFSRGKRVSEIRYKLIGAIGELQTLSALVRLPSSYVIFNNLILSFDRALRYKKKDGLGRGYIMSQQIDHVVVGPTGVFVIESKYWGHHTVVETLQLGGYDVFEQIFRCKRALNRYLKYEMGSSPRILQIIVQSGTTKFSGKMGVNVVQPNELAHYIRFGSACLHPEQVERIVEALIEGI